MSQPPLSQRFFLFLKNMAKVIKGALPGERVEGYESYKTKYGVGPSVAVRRAIPTTEIAAVGTSLAQRQQKYAFAVATNVYSKFNDLEKDFYHRWWVIDQAIDPLHRLGKRILTGRQLAISLIRRSIMTQGEPYQKPLPFCICAVDIAGNPALGHELNITSEKLWNFTYKEGNDNFACFPPSSLSPKYEPYHLFYTDAADYCYLTAEQIHNIKMLSVEKLQQLWQRKKSWGDCYGSYEPLYKFDFQALNIFEEEVEVTLIWKSSFSSFGYIHRWIYCVGVHNVIKTDIYPGENITTVTKITVKDGCNLARDWRAYGSGPIALSLTETIAINDEKPC